MSRILLSLCLKQLKGSKNLRKLLGIEERVLKPLFDETVGAIGKPFVTVNGEEHRVFPGFRDAVKPSAGRSGSDRTARDHPRNRVSVEQAERVLNLYGASLRGADVLEVGCSSGGRMLAISHYEPKSLVGSNFDGYPAPSLAGSSQREKPDEPAEGGLSILSDDICASGFETASLDVIVSWQTLEHVRDPDLAITEMARLLRPGGVLFAEYNPFFSITGGHRLCTGDWPWAHVTLGDDEFQRFLLERRPSEADEASRFYVTSLNRLNLSAMHKIMDQSPFAVWDLIAWPRRSVLWNLSDERLHTAKKIFGDLAVADLISDSVWLVARLNN